MKKYYKNIEQKANNTNAIKVLYKRPGQAPEARIIDNVYKLKKAIIKEKLDMIPYQNVFIICYSKEKRKKEALNIILDFFHISGDLLVVEIDRRKREIQSLSEENIAWFTKDLNNKNPIEKTIDAKSDLKKIANCFSDEIKNIKPTRQSNTNFENSLINALTRIEQAVSGLGTGQKADKSGINLTCPKADKKEE